MLTGSSPLARGGRPRTGAPQAVWGSSRSRGADYRPSRATVHYSGSSPLARGGPDHRQSRRRRRGSSPLARGGRTSRRCRPRSRGLIPARAGRTPKAPTRRRGRRAHPARAGRTTRFLPHLSGPRVHPARAGRTSRSPTTTPQTPAHPRSRGGLQNGCCCPPPHWLIRSRGADVSEVGDGGVMTRFIPARAGCQRQAETDPLRPWVPRRILGGRCNTE